MKYQYIKCQNKIATLMVTFGAGSRVESKENYNNGISHLIEHLRFRGGEKYDSNTISQKISYWGGYTNAWTSEDLVNYYLSIPEENINYVLPYFSEIIFPSFSEDGIKKEKIIVCQEMKDRMDSIETQMGEKLYSKVFNNSLKYSIIGNEKSIQLITRDEILKFNNQFYNENNALVTFVSPKDHYKDISKNTLRGWKNNNILNFIPPDQKVVYNPSFKTKVTKQDTKQNSIFIAYGGFTLQQYKQFRLAGWVFNEAFGSGPDSRLFIKVREEKGLVYGIGSSYSNHFDGILFNICTSTEPKHTKNVLNIINEQIKNIKQSLITKKELQKAKNKILRHSYDVLESSHGIASIHMRKEFYNKPSLKEDLQNVQKVTEKDVLNFANKLFNQNCYTVIGQEK